MQRANGVSLTCKLVHVSRAWQRGLGFLAIAIALGVSGGSQAAVSELRARITYAADGHVWVMNGDGSRSRRLAVGASPTWSPDGSLIAFESARIPGNGLDIYLMNADGSGQRRMVTHPGGGGDHPINKADDFAPAWSPAGSGRTIAFVTNRDGNNEIYTMDSIGHSTQRLTSSPASDRDPAWSPDGEAVAFVSDRDGNDEIYAVDQRQDVVRLTRNADADRAPAWSPDRRSIAFQSFRDGNWEIYVMDAAGGNERRLTQSDSADTNPSWSPDGDTIVFTTSAGGTPHLAQMSPSGGAARPLTAQLADQAEWQSLDDVALTVRHPRTIRRGQRARLRIAIRNKTAMPAFNVIVASVLPLGTRVVSARAGGFAGSCVGSGPRRVSCWIPRLARSATVSAVVVLRARRCGRATIRQAVSSGQTDAVPADNRRRITLRVSC